MDEPSAVVVDELALARAGIAAVLRAHGIEVSRKTLSDARARLEAGVVNKVEVQRAETALLRAEQNLREAETSRSSAYRALRTLARIDEPIRVMPGEARSVASTAEAQLIDQIVAVNGQQALDMARQLARREGIFCGTSGGATFAGAMHVATQAPPNTTILCMLPDTGERYLSTPLFDGIPEQMTEEEMELARSTPGYRFDVPAATGAARAARATRARGAEARGPHLCRGTRRLPGGRGGARRPG